MKVLELSLLALLAIGAIIVAADIVVAVLVWLAVRVLI